MVEMCSVVKWLIFEGLVVTNSYSWQKCLSSSERSKSDIQNIQFLNVSGFHKLEYSGGLNTERVRYSDGL